MELIVSRYIYALGPVLFIAIIGYIAGLKEVGQFTISTAWILVLGTIGRFGSNTTQVGKHLEEPNDEGIKYLIKQIAVGLVVVLGIMLLIAVFSRITKFEQKINSWECLGVIFYSIMGLKTSILRAKGEAKEAIKYEWPNINLMAIPIYLVLTVVKTQLNITMERTEIIAIVSAMLLLIAVKNPNAKGISRNIKNMEWLDKKIAFKTPISVTTQNVISIIQSQGIFLLLSASMTVEDLGKLKIIQQIAAVGIMPMLAINIKYAPKLLKLYKKDKKKANKIRLNIGLKISIVYSLISMMVVSLLIYFTRLESADLQIRCALIIIMTAQIVNTITGPVHVLVNNLEKSSELLIANAATTSIIILLAVQSSGRLIDGAIFLALMIATNNAAAEYILRKGFK